MEVKVGGPAPTTRSSEYRVVYSNSAKVQLTPWDLKFIFSQLLETVEGGTVNEEAVTVVMSPQHAKALLQHWANTIKQYEATFGTIEDPSSRLEEIAKQAMAEAQKNQKSGR